MPGLFKFLFFDDPPDFLPASFSGQGLLDAFLFAWFQIKGVLLDLLDDVFLLNPPLETPERILNGFTFLNANFSQLHTPPICCR